MEKKLNELFRNMCCSKCRNDFDENSITIVRQEDSDEENILVAKLCCQHCGKSFGLAFLGLNDIELKNKYTDNDIAFEMHYGVPPITTDDVLDAHQFIKNLDENWKKYLPKKNK